MNLLLIGTLWGQIFLVKGGNTQGLEELVSALLPLSVFELQKLLETLHLAALQLFSKLHLVFKLASYGFLEVGPKRIVKKIGHFLMNAYFSCATNVHHLITEHARLDPWT